MIRNYFIVMVRTLLRHKFQTAVNILGLTVAIAFAMLTGAFVAAELEVNKTLKESDQLYLMRSTIGGEATPYDFFTPALLAKTVHEQFPGKLKDYYRFWDRSITVSKGDRHFRIQSMIGDPSFLAMFGFTVLYGDATTSLSKPNSVIITESAAIRFFDRTDVVDETLSISTEQNGLKDYVVNAVIADPDDKNTVTDLMNMDAQIFLPLLNVRDFLGGSSSDSWKDMIISYIKLEKDVTRQDAEKILNAILVSDAPKEISENRRIEISPLSDYYLITNHGAVLKLIKSLLVIILFIIILATTNFINISIAGSIGRLKEVGIRKVVGGGRTQLVVQFLTESVLLSTAAVLIALVMYQFLFPVFSGMLNTKLPAFSDFKLLYWILIGLLPVVVGVSAGLYPALFQSGSKPIESLKGKSASVQGTVSFSRVLIALQFVITVFILIGSIIISRQTDFFLGQDLGYDKAHVIIVNSVPRDWSEQGFQRIEGAKPALLQSAAIESVTLSWGVPAWGIGGPENELYKDGTSGESTVKASLTGADENFDEVYGLKLLAGDFLFADASPLIRKRFVLNKSAADALSVSVGDRVRVKDSEDVFTVAGVVGDFHYESMHAAVKPMAFMHNRDFESYRFYSFRLKAGSPAASVEEVKRVWRNAFPDEPFSHYFADERVQALYSTEMQLKKASNVASVLMLVIIMTGVLGLVSLNVSKRNKEVGIRKALGATVTNILVMFSSEYVKLVLFSFAVGIPLAFYFAANWLENFVYHIPLDWWMFVVPGVFLLMLTILLVGIQSYNTAKTNPVNSLRHE
jgi:putative ABC transport system permease protein